MGLAGCRMHIDGEGHAQAVAQVRRSQSAALHIFLAIKLSLVLAAETIFRSGQVNCQFRVVGYLGTAVVEPVAHESPDFAAAIEVHVETAGTFAAVEFEEALAVAAVL